MKRPLCPGQCSSIIPSKTVEYSSSLSLHISWYLIEGVDSTVVATISGYNYYYTLIPG